MPKPRTSVRISPTRATRPARLPSSTASHDQNRCITRACPSRVALVENVGAGRGGRRLLADRRLAGWCRRGAPGRARGRRTAGGTRGRRGPGRAVRWLAWRPLPDRPTRRGRAGGRNASSASAAAGSSTPWRWSCSTSRASASASGLADDERAEPARAQGRRAACRGRRGGHARPPACGGSRRRRRVMFSSSANSAAMR